MARCARARKRSDYRPMSPRDMILCPSVEKRNSLDSRREIVQTRSIVSYVSYVS